MPSQIRDVVGSLEGRLGDLRREQAWRVVERAIAVPPEVQPRSWWRVPALVTVACTCTAFVMWWLTRATVTAITPDTAELVAAVDHTAILERRGIVLTLVGPGTASVEDRPGGVHVRVSRGVLIADRTPDASSLTITAGTSTTTTRDARCAVRDEPGTVVFGAGHDARASVERHVLTLATPARVAVPPPVIVPRPVTVPPPVIAPRPRPPSIAAPAPPITKAPELVIPPSSASDLYARAEAALRVRDPAQARALLERLLDEHREDPLVDAARYDLALLALERKDTRAALQLSEQLITSARDPNLRRAARKLRDRIR
ncbi:MAG: tetratricopeptide repeat protein [Kofleriaceae bacterium]